MPTSDDVSDEALEKMVREWFRTVLPGAPADTAIAFAKRIRDLTESATARRCIEARQFMSGLAARFIREDLREVFMRNAMDAAEAIYDLGIRDGMARYGGEPPEIEDEPVVLGGEGGEGG